LKKEKFLSALNDSKKLFDLKRTKDIKFHDDHIEAAELIISQIATGVSNIISKLNEEPSAKHEFGHHHL